MTNFEKWKNKLRIAQGIDYISHSISLYGCKFCPVRCHGKRKADIQCVEKVIDWLTEEAK